MAFVEIRRKDFHLRDIYTLSLVLSITDAPEDMDEVSIGKGRIHHTEVRRKGKIFFTEACPAGDVDEDWKIVQDACRTIGITLEQCLPEESMEEKLFRFSFPGYE